MEDGNGSSDQGAAGDLLASVYDELRRLAGFQLAGERAGHTLQATALVNEAWVKLAGRGDFGVETREEFLRLASRVMRNVLVDHARARNADKRGGGWQRLTLSAAMDESARELDVLALDDALTELATMSESMARLVELRFFGGMTEPEAAAVVGISRAEAARQWRTARAWLGDKLGMID